MIRVITMATVLAASLVGSSAFAQTTTGTNKAFCLSMSGSGNMQCNYDTMAQCESARTGGAGSCKANPDMKK